MSEIEKRKRTRWWERVIGAAVGAVVGVVFGVIAAVLGVLFSGAWWMVLLGPICGFLIGFVVGAVMPGWAIYMFDHTSFMGRPLSMWFLD